MIVRADCYGVFNVVVATVCKPILMMHFQVGGSICIYIEKRGFALEDPTHIFLSRYEGDH